MKRIDHLRVLLISLGAVTLAMFLTVNGRAGWSFPHAKHLEASGVACADCHSAAAQSKSGKDDLRPGAGYLPQLPHGRGPRQLRIRRAREALERILEVLARAAPGDRGYRLHPLPRRADRHEGGRHGQGTDRPRGLLRMPRRSEGRRTSARAATITSSSVRPLDHAPDYLHTHQFSARDAVGAVRGVPPPEHPVQRLPHGRQRPLPQPRSELRLHARGGRSQARERLHLLPHRATCNDCHMQERVKPTNHAQELDLGHEPARHRGASATSGTARAAMGRMIRSAPSATATPTRARGTTRASTRANSMTTTCTGRGTTTIRTSATTATRRAGGRRILRLLPQPRSQGLTEDCSR